METSVVAKHPKCITVVHKDHHTIFMLLKSTNSMSNLTTSGTTTHANQGQSQLKIVELDTTTQTVCSSTDCLVFEGVMPHDTDYSLVYSSGFLVLIYPTQMISIYQDNGYFAKRMDDANCRGLDFYDLNLVGH